MAEDNKENYCFITKDYSGLRVVFTKKQYELKAKLRPELREKGILDRVKETTESPDFVYEDYEKKNRFAYYSREYRINSRTRYMKVILSKGKNCLFTITAFRPDYVKEINKTKLLYGNDNE